MPAHKETKLQICIICFLVFMLGARVDNTPNGLMVKSELLNRLLLSVRLRRLRTQASFVTSSRYFKQQQA
jgi:hypothetical protein